MARSAQSSAKSTVRISANERILGSGFFIEKDLIVTCAHVVRRFQDNTWQLYPKIDLHWQGRIKLSHYEIVDIIDEPYDLAFIRVISDVIVQPLDKVSVPYLGEELLIFGYTQDFKLGAPDIVIYEGLTGDKPPYIKFKGNRIQPGLSGAPIVRVRNGELCGMVKFTLDRSQSIGGGGITALDIKPILVSYQLSAAEEESYVKVRDLEVDVSEAVRLGIRVEAVTTREQHAEMWRWNQRMFRVRHPKSYTDFDLVGLELGRSWWLAYPEQDWVLRDQFDEQIGHYCLCPISENAYYDLVDGRRIETQLGPQDILPPDGLLGHSYWYLANFMRAKAKPGIPGEAARYASDVMVAHFMHRMLNNTEFATAAGREISIVAFVEASSIRSTVEKFRFRKAHPNTKDDELNKIYISSWNRKRIEIQLEKTLTDSEQCLKKLSAVVSENVQLFQQPPNY